MLVGKLKYVFITLILLMAPNIVHAECSYERVAELSRIASNVQFSYDYEMVADNPIFTVHINNLANDIYITDNYGQQYIGTGEYNAVYQNGEEIAFTIFSNDSNCRNEEIITKYLSLPHFNVYSLDPVCTEIPNFQYCSLWLDNEGIDYATFINKANEYKQSKAMDNAADTTEQITWWETLLDYFSSHMYIFVMIIGLIILIIIYKRMNNR